MREIQGIIPPTVTPFIKGTKKVDTGVVREHMEFLIERGIHGVYSALKNMGDSWRQWLSRFEEG